MSDKKEKKEINFKIDGQDVVAHEGETVIAAAHRHGIEIPHYCYHPSLPVDGNCRICIAKFAAPRGGEMAEFPKPMTTCTTFPSEGMEVDTQSEEVREMRKGIMEFLLINHPLDCPVCDQAGECTLQDYAYEYGRAKGRFKEKKVNKHTKHMGPTVDLWGERCIVCTRCVRFVDEVSGTGEIGVTHRGDHAVVDISPGHELENPLSMNVVDICPVGALVSRDFLFDQRVWYLKSVPSISGISAKGSNILIDYDKKVRRIRSRPNPDVNGYWIADRCRMFYKHVNDPNRIPAFYVREGNDLEKKPNHRVIESVVEKFKEMADDGKKIAVLGSLYLTCESMHLLTQWAEKIGAEDQGVLQGPVEDDREFPGFTIEGDQNPNRPGGEIFFGKKTVDKGLKDVIKKIEKGEISGLFLSSNIPYYEPDEKFLKALDKLDYFVVTDLIKGPFTEKADTVLGTAAFTEENGIYINKNGKWQSLNIAVRAPGQAEQTHAILQRLLMAWEGETGEPLSQVAMRKRMFNDHDKMAKVDQENEYPELANLPKGTKALSLYY